MMEMVVEMKGGGCGDVECGNRTKVEVKNKVDFDWKQFLSIFGTFDFEAMSKCIC